jgi:hypothetical protein
MAAQRILITGSSGLIGSALVSLLTAGGHRVIRLVRSEPRAAENEVHWDPTAGRIDASRLEGLDAVVHLAGENIGAARWTPERKARLRESRVKGTQLLCDSLAKLSARPQVLVSASAIGYYGNRGDEILHEESPPGSGFLAEMAREWEAATEAAANAGIRVVNLRIAVVLSATGGALARMLMPFRLGVGGILGDGKQYMSWIALDDLVQAIVHSITTESLRGPVNAGSPHPVTNYEFTKTLGRVLGRPTFLPMPSFAARLAFGEMADELLLAGTRVEPTKLLASGFKFRQPELESALRHTLKMIEQDKR